MQEPLSQKFNQSAPPYDPDLWNSQVSDADLLKFLDTHREALTKVLTYERMGGPDSFPVDRTKTAITAFNKAIVTLNDDTKVAERFGMSVEDVEKLKPLAKDIYLAQGFQSYANCYSYAMNDHDRHSYLGDTPGRRASDLPGQPNYPILMIETESRQDYDEFKRLLIKSVEADGAIIGGKDAAPIDGHYRVGVYAMPPGSAPKGDNTWTDMHFVRENQDGTWSHKAGSLPVTNKDMDGQLITDPKTANIGRYEFLTYVYVPEGGLDVGNGYEPKTKPGSIDVPLNPKEDWKRRDSAPFPELTR